MTRSSIHPEDADPTTTSDVLEDLRAVVRDAEELLRATEGDLSERVADIRTRVEGTLESARERLHESVDNQGERLKSAARTSENYVRENPWTAVLIAAGVGFLIGAIGTAARRR